MSFIRETVHVSVPATSANLGPGYDCLGLALDWRDELEARVTGGELSITVEGANANGVPRDDSHLVVRAMNAGFTAMGLPMPGVALNCVNAVPHSRGLGSSASAIVGGLCLARSLAADPDVRLDDRTLFQIASEMEGHPDNVAAALMGGLVISGQRDPGEPVDPHRPSEKYFAHRSAVHPDLVAVVFVPEHEVETKTSRGLLPHNVSHRDASQNTGRAALLVSAIAGSPELLVTATRDFLHQDYRESAMPETLALVGGLRRRGVAAVVSGAGPSVLAITTHEQAQSVAEHGAAGWDTRVLAIDPDGARES